MPADLSLNSLKIAVGKENHHGVQSARLLVTYNILISICCCERNTEIRFSSNEIFLIKVFQLGYINNIFIYF